MKNKVTHLLSKATTFCKSYIELCLWLLIFSIGIRFFETVLLYRVNHNFASSIVWNLIGLCYDISLYLRLSVCILPIFIATCFLSEKITRIIFRVLQSLMLLLSLICILFFATSGFLLDKVVFAYSLKEIVEIIQSSSKSSAWVYFVVTVLPILYYYLSGKRIKINHVLAITFAVLIPASFFIFKDLSINAKQYHVKTNKEYFFLKSVLKRQTSSFEENDEQVRKTVQKFRNFFPELQFEETDFPFLYQAVYKDVLSPFFNLKPEPPNFVFIIVEGLAYNFLKNDYQLMPFLDSLSKESLSWENCLSVAPRTYGVLPGLFGAAPIGEKGFMDRCPNNPAHHTLLSILHQNNYTQNFFYSGSMDFDNMRHFFNENNTAYLENDDWDKDITNQKGKFAWGCEDHLLFLQAHRKLSQITSSPRTDIFLTLTSHDPYEYPESSRFQKKVENNVIQNKKLSDEQKNSILREIKLYSAFAYSDWALQQLMESYKKRPDFDNTIFIITGDHHPCPQQFAGYRNYHVALIIYSPMLKSGRNMKGVVSHRDITPSFLSMLQNKYHINSPKEVTWLNRALDTSLTFNANSFSPLQLTDHRLGGVMYKNHIYCEGVLEELTDGPPLRIDNKNILQRMEKLLSLYQACERYILYNETLIKNNDTPKHMQTEVVINIEDTIAQNSYFAKDSELEVVEGPENHKATLYLDSTYLFPIKLLHYKVPYNDIEKFMVEIEFNIYINNDDKTKVLNLVLDLTKNNQAESVQYEAEYFKFDRQNRWYRCKKVMIYKKETFAYPADDYVLKVYLWNPNRLEAYLDDIKVKVTITVDE